MTRLNFVNLRAKFESCQIFDKFNASNLIGANFIKFTPIKAKFSLKTRRLKTLVLATDRHLSAGRTAFRICGLDRFRLV